MLLRSDAMFRRSSSARLVTVAAAALAMTLPGGFCCARPLQRNSPAACCSAADSSAEFASEVTVDSRSLDCCPSDSTDGDACDCCCLDSHAAPGNGTASDTESVGHPQSDPRAATCPAGCCRGKLANYWPASRIVGEGAEADATGFGSSDVWPPVLSNFVVSNWPTYPNVSRQRLLCRWRC